MVSFQRMSEEIDGIGSHISQKFPVLGKSGCCILVTICVAVVLLIGVGMGMAMRSDSVNESLDGPESAPFIQNLGGEGQQNVPFYTMVSDERGSCPELTGTRLITTMKKGDSFPGLIVDLACRGDYNAFPNQVKCMRSPSNPKVFEWSHLPVCYPSVLISKEHWSQTLHARSVTCNGNRTHTECRMSCIRDYVPVEKEPFTCDSMPCPMWIMRDSKCVICHKSCEDLHALENPQTDALLGALKCSNACSEMLVISKGNAAVWQNKRTGLFKFLGEHNGRPVYQNKATKEFLYYTTTGSEWLVGPDFRKPHAGIQMYGNDDTQCPERAGTGANVTKLFIDSSVPSMGGVANWTSDETLEFKCKPPGFKPVSCKCENYKVYNLAYSNNETVPLPVTLFTGNFTRVKSEAQRTSGLLAPMYKDELKNLYLFSHDPYGRVWQISTKLSSTPLRGVMSEDGSCPDSGGTTMEWEYYNKTTPLGQQIYIADSHIKVKCLDGYMGH